MLCILPRVEQHCSWLKVLRATKAHQCHAGHDTGQHSTGVGKNCNGLA